MNFYKHHLGDYASKTLHLSWDEDCAYRRLMDQYYKREQPIPADLKDACRLARATTPAQRRAVEAVLKEFFTPEADGWHQKRCDEELAEAAEYGDERDAKTENEKERQRRHRAERKRLFEVLRCHDVVPPWDTKIEALRERLSHVTGNVAGSGPVTPVTLPATRTATAIHTPRSKIQDPRSNTQEQSSARTSTAVAARPRESADKNKLTPEAELAIPLREAGVKVSSMHPVLVDWVRDGFTLQQALGAVAIARERKPQGDIAANYLDTILRNPHVPKVNGHASAHAQAAPRKKSPIELANEALEQAVRAGKSDREILRELAGQGVDPSWIAIKREECAHEQR